MPGTNRIYEEPSRLSQGLVVGLSVAVVAMAGWFVVTVTVSQTPTTAAEGDTEAAATPPPAATSADAPAVSGAADAAGQRTNHFDWPQFTTVPATPSSGRALSLVPELTPTHGFEGPAWTAPAVAPNARNASSRTPSGRAAEAADAIADILVPPPSRTATAALPPPPRQTQRKPKPPSENDAAAQ